MFGIGGVGKNRLFFTDDDYLAFERVIADTLEKRGQNWSHPSD
jgi:hypothetical protein